MKLAYLADIRFPMERANGIQTVETCHAVARAGTEVELVVQRSDDRTDPACLDFYGLAPHPNLTLRRLVVPHPGSLAAKLVFAAKSLKLVSSHKFHAVYTRDLTLADWLLRLQPWLRLPVFYEAHTSAASFSEEAHRLYRNTAPPPPTRRKIARLRRREKRVCRKASRLITITRELQLFLERAHGSLAPVEVIPDGAHVPNQIPPLREPEAGTPIRVTYIGQLYPWKGVDTLLEAMVELRGERLVIVGGLPPEPDLDRTRNQARHFGVSDRVEFRGYVPPARLIEERRTADIFVVPTLDSVTARHFTSPLKLFEAMAAGRPIVASDLPSLRVVLTDGVNALLVPPGDSKALAEAVRKLAGDRQLRARLAQRAGEDVRRYSWDERGRRIAHLLAEIRKRTSS